MVEIAIALMQSLPRDFFLLRRKLNAMFLASETQTICVVDSHLRPSMLQVNSSFLLFMQKKSMSINMLGSTNFTQLEVSFVNGTALTSRLKFSLKNDVIIKIKSFEGGH